MGLLNDILETIRSVRDKITGELSERIENVHNTVNSIPEKIDDLIDSFIDGVERIEGKILDKLGEWTDSISRSYHQAVDTVTTRLGNAIAWVKESTDKLAQAIRDKIDDSIDMAIAIYTDAKAKLQEWFENAVENAKQTAKAIGDKIHEVGERIYSGVREAWETATTRIQEFLRGLWEKILALLEKLLGHVFDLLTWVNEDAYPFVKTVFENTKTGLSSRKDAAIMLWKGCQTGDVGAIAEGLKQLTTITEPTDLTSFLIAMGLFSAIIPQASAVYVKPGLELVLQSVNANMPVAVASQDNLIRAAMRQIITMDKYFGDMAKHGIARDTASLLLETARPLPTLAVIQDAFLRGFISESEHDTYLRKYGFTDKDIALQKALYRIIPGVSDIIRMAVREAFTPEIAEKFGQYQDLPAAFVEWAEKQGLSREWAERYWAAHWDLPSLTMGYQMYHRRIIDENELKLLMRALDIMPFWRDKLIQLSYTPYTRVDLRRMYSMGVLTENDVYQAYLDLGYSPEKARNLTDFTVRYYAPEEETTLDKYRELTRSIYTQAYKKGVITADECLRYLVQIGYKEDDARLLLAIADAELALQYAREDTIPMRTQTTNLVVDAYKRGLLLEPEARDTLASLGYTNDEIEWYIALTDYQKTLNLKTLVLETIHKRYVERTITKAEAVGELGKLFPIGREQETLFDVWDVEREARVRKLTEAQYRAALQRGYISVEEYADELRGLGYAEKYVQILVKLATGGKYGGE